MRKAALVVAALLITLPAVAQVPPPVTCDVSAIPNLVRMSGTSELTGDLVLTCSGGVAGLSDGVINLTLFLNVPATPKLTAAGSSETMVLIDEPAPGVPDLSNGCAYAGQVLGTLGLPACAAGSGNVYLGSWSLGAENVISWTGVPFVQPGPGGTRTLRITNIRADADEIDMDAAGINALVAIVSTSAITLNQPAGGTLVATMYDPITFTASPVVGAVGALDLKFAEKADSMFKKRIENTLGGPLTAVLQDQPGMWPTYCTESGFTPQFGTTTPGDLGSADTGTRLLAEFSGLPGPVFVLIVPNEVTSASGTLVAHRVYPPFNANDTGGTIPIIPGYGLVVVSATHSAQVLYEVTANAPYQGVNGCALITSFTIPVFSFFPAAITPAMVTGRLAPVDGTITASTTAPRPRFEP